MTEYKACPASWDQVKKWNEIGSESSSCILELRARVEALEAAQQPNVKKEMQGLQGGTRLLSYRVENFALPIEEWGEGHTIVDSAKPAESNYPAPSHSLVERVADTIYINAMGGVCEQARAAIREIAAWLRQRDTYVRASVQIAGVLERAANQHSS